MSKRFDPEAHQREQQKRTHEKYALWREQIIAQAGDDLIELTWPADGRRTSEDDELDEAWGVIRHLSKGGTIRIPRAPFLHSCFARLGWYNELLPPWTPVSSPGVKCSMDDPFHTDWLIGGGIDPNDGDVYGTSNFAKACDALRDRHHAELEALVRPDDPPSPVEVIVPGPRAVGTVYHGKGTKPAPRGSIVVLPNLHQRYVTVVQHAAAIIAEAGGKTAHLAQVGRDISLPIVRMVGAQEHFAAGSLAMVETNTDPPIVQTLTKWNT